MKSYTFIVRFSSDRAMSVLEEFIMKSLLKTGAKGITIDATERMRRGAKPKNRPELEEWLQRFHKVGDRVTAEGAHGDTGMPLYSVRKVFRELVEDGTLVRVSAKGTTTNWYEYQGW